MHGSSLPSAAATATLPRLDAPHPLPTRGPPASNGRPAYHGAAASAELTRYLTEDHDRIAQGINDVVVRRIFAAGLDLHAALGLIGDHRGASKIWHAIDELDQAVRDIRDTIFDATGPRAGQTPRAHRVDLPA
jgi:signal transduction histidine kinase